MNHSKIYWGNDEISEISIRRKTCEAQAEILPVSDVSATGTERSEEAWPAERFVDGFVVEWSAGSGKLGERHIPRRQSACNRGGPDAQERAP
jgi:hypothetical protein